MTTLQTFGITLFTILSLVVFLKGVYESSRKNNAYGLTPYLTWMGIFVWGDAVIFGFFWFLAALTSYFLQDELLFLLIVSVFWVVRSLGETIYWFNQQFSTINRNPPENLKHFKVFKNDSIWFIYQLIWQCVLVVSIIASIYLAKHWFASL